LDKSGSLQNNNPALKLPAQAGSWAVNLEDKMKVAIVHYWLVTMRGGEKVLESLLNLFPGADIFTHVYNPDAVSGIIKSHRVYTSFIQKLPFAVQLYQKYMPLMPRALNGFNLQGYDLVISSESGPAKGVVPAPGAFHLCYCHTPMRYIWDMYHDYYRESGVLTRFFMKRMVPSLRVWDIVSSNLVDRFAANSAYVASRIRRYYNRDSDIVHPPVAVEKYAGLERKPEDFYLFFGQLTGYKRLDIAIDACAALGKKLVVIGSGMSAPQKKMYEKSGFVVFPGRADTQGIGSYFSRAKALLFPGIEDFGIVPVEAMAAGCPVIAFRKGGAVETVREGVTGLFFDEQSPEALAAAIESFENNSARYEDRNAFNAHVQRFSEAAFQKKILSLVSERKRA
jgi:glycosyltransferase involved in cell wall biosynthesis